MLLLEAGPNYPDTDQLPNDLKWGGNYLMSAFGQHTWGYIANTTSQQPRPVPVPRGKVTGGTSTIHGQFFLRGLPQDYDHWAALGNADWAFDDVLPWFKKLERDLDFGGEYHGSGGRMPVRRLSRDAMLPCGQAFYAACIAAGFSECPDHNDPHSTGVGPATSNNRGGIRVSTALAYLNHARTRQNLTLRPNFVATRILFEGRHAKAVEVESDGNRVIIEADQILLSAGAIASPHLLMLSGVGPAESLTAAGIEVVQELPGVGDHLLDDPYVLPVFRAKGSPDLGPISVEVVFGTLLRDRQHATTSNSVLPGSTALIWIPQQSRQGEACFCIYAALMHADSIGQLT